MNSCCPRAYQSADLATGSSSSAGEGHQQIHCFYSQLWTHHTPNEHMIYIYICIGFCNFDTYFVYLEAFIYDRLSNFILENTYYCKWTHYVLSSLYTKWELRCSNHTKIICSICHQYNISISIWFQQLGPKSFRASGSLLRQGGITSGDWKSRSRGKRDRSGCRIQSICI